MRTSIMLFLLSVTGIAALSGCATGNPQTLVQSALADTHLGWQPAPENQLSYTISTRTGIARVEMRELPADLQTVVLDLPGMQKLEGMQWRGGNGRFETLYDGANGSSGLAVERQGHGFRVSIAGDALDLVRSGGVLTVIDYYRN